MNNKLHGGSFFQTNLSLYGQLQSKHQSNQRRETLFTKLVNF